VWAGSYQSEGAIVKKNSTCVYKQVHNVVSDKKNAEWSVRFGVILPS
jgi:hypothetical protein